MTTQTGACNRHWLWLTHTRITHLHPRIEISPWINITFSKHRGAIWITPAFCVPEACFTCVLLGWGLTKSKKIKKTWKNESRCCKTFVTPASKLHLQYPRGHHLLYPTSCWVVSTNVLITAFIQVLLPDSCRVHTKKPYLCIVGVASFRCL